jgi:hypothetical protein
MTAPQYTGHLRKGAEPGTIEGEIVDRWGWKILINGRRTDDGYALTATVSDPGSLRVPAIDGEEPKS